MKKSFNLILVTLVISMFVACGGSVEVSPKMQSFMDAIMIEQGITGPADTYGYTADNIPLDLYELSSPKVLSADGDCYTMEVTHGIFQSSVIVCWSNDKIISIEEVEE